MGRYFIIRELLSFEILPQLFKGWINHYQLDSDLSRVERYPPFEQLRPDVV